MSIAAPRFESIEAYEEHFDPNWIVPFPGVDREYIWTYPLALQKISIKSNNDFIFSKQWPEQRLTIYIHVPYCKSSCPFCAFMHTILDEKQLESYVDCLIKEIQWYSKHPGVQNTKLTAVYFGGGTASLLKPSHIDRILVALKIGFNLSPDVEVSLECHPDTIDYQYLDQVKSKGVNRISIGVQSFNPKNLQLIGRKQSAPHAFDMVSYASEIFKTVSVDIIYRIPNQSAKSAIKDIKKAIDIGVQSISTYSLETSDTLLSDISMHQASDEADKNMFFTIRKFLLDAGFIHMAQPDYCLPNHENKYLKGFWSAPQALNLGLGAGGHSGWFAGYTFCNMQDPGDYIELISNEQLPIILNQKIDKTEAMARYFVLGFRGISVPLEPFERIFGESPNNIFFDQFESLRKIGLIGASENEWYLSELGEYYVDTVSKHFYTKTCKGKKVPWGSDIKCFKPNIYYSMLTPWA
jgi:oxygen-independent coproporphyrinogen III oxidase